MAGLEENGSGRFVIGKAKKASQASHILWEGLGHAAVSQSKRFSERASRTGFA
jgi:hypothetical protein